MHLTEEPDVLQVFVFMANEKGGTWAYATPGFGASLEQPVLKLLRDLAVLPPGSRNFTEVSHLAMLRH
jgi:hypothetical protein